MSGFVRRFTFFPSLDVITEIEGVAVVDLIPPGIFIGRRTGTVLLAGEWPKGPYNTPTLVEGSSTIRDAFGGFSLSCRSPLAADNANPYSNGNAFVWLKAKKFRRVVLVRPNLEVGTVTITLAGTPTPTAQQVVIPAGTRIRNPAAPTSEFALAQDVVFAVGVVVGTGPQAFTLGIPQTQTQVTGVPVYSTQGVSALATVVTQIDSGDLQRAGIGAGAALPNYTVAVSNVGALTVLTSGQIDTAYSNALASTLPGTGGTAADNVDLVASARQSSNIRSALLANAAAASSVGTGRAAILRPPIGTNSTAARGGGDPGVGANRGDRAFYAYPHVLQFIEELATLDPAAAISGPNILVGFDAAVASVCSCLPPERNPGQSTQEVVSGGLLSWIRDLEPGLTTANQPTAWGVENYKDFKESGIMAARRDPRISEWIIQSGVTAVDPALFPSLSTAKRRRMADFIQDSCATIALKFNKLPRTADRESAVIGELTAFLETLKSDQNPAAKRIEDYAIDTISGNTKELAAAGIFVVIVEVRLLGTLDFIVLQTTIGEAVEVSSTEQLAA